MIVIIHQTSFLASLTEGLTKGTRDSLDIIKILRSLDFMKKEAQVVRLTWPGADSVHSADALSFKNSWMTDNRIPLFVAAPDLSTLVPGVEPWHIRISQSLCKGIPLTQCKGIPLTQCKELGQSGRRWSCSCSLHSSLFCEVNPLPIL